MFSLTTMVLSTALMAPGGSIADVASSSDDFETLVAAASAAGLVGLLDGDQQLTVFAPTDTAFGAIDSSTLKGLLEEPGTPTLRRILAHHVVAGSLNAEKLSSLESVETLAGTTLPVTVARGRVLIGDSVVSAANIEADNGVIHVIDRVLMPPPQEPAIVRFLTGAVERGVPTFNDGDPGACADIYATAIDAIALSSGWGLSPEEQGEVVQAAAEAASVGDESERAWAYRRIIDAVLGTRLMIGQGAAANKSRMILDFEDSDEERNWQIVLDGVMGGLSTGQIEVDRGVLRFTGETSLRNNGGFSSVRRTLPEGVLDGKSTMRMRVRGDGRTWIVGTRKSRRRGGDSYWTRFNTVDGEWMTIDVPIREMERHFFGNRLAGSISPEEVVALEFYMYDKKAGPFQLEVASIEGVNSEVLASR